MREDRGFRYAKDSWWDKHFRFRKFRSGHYILSIKIRSYWLVITLNKNLATSYVIK